ncbi:MAG: M48 family metallopeptidase [Chlorobi bacterium]|nr:M48 family metallopeptidase [Chlorobiota bacterium]
METILFWIIISIVIFDFIFEKTLDYLNIKNLTEKLPDELKGIYDEDKYKKSQAYQKTSSRFSLISSSFSLVLILMILFFGGFAYLDNFVRNLSGNIYIRTLSFFGILGIVVDLLSVPFQIYSTFIIEEKFGFNKTSPLTFVLDKLKSWGISIVIGGAVISFILWSWLSLGGLFVPVVLGGLTFFMIFMAMFYSSLIVPLFNKLTPLEEGSLKSKIQEFASKSNFRLKNIYTINGSKRSTRANAYFSGLGPKKMIVLYDTLINDLTEDEIVAVLAHEVGHYKKKHIYQGLLVSVLQTALMLYLLSLALEHPVFSKSIGGVDGSFYMAIISFGLLYSPLSFVSGILSNKLSRKNEYQADAYAKSFSLSDELISSLKKLSVNNLSNLSPHKLYVYFNYSHPTLLQRIAELTKQEA